MESTTLWGTPTRVATYYDKLTLLYRIFYHPTHLHYGYFTHAWMDLNRAVATMSLQVGKRFGTLSASSHLLDAGCGIGGTAQLLAETHGCPITGVTISARQQRNAQKRAARSKASKLLTYQQADYLNTPFPNATFDGAYSVEASCYATDKRAFLKEMARVLKPGGKLVIACAYTRKPHAQFTPQENETYQTFCAGWEVPNLPHIADMAIWAQQEGFTIVTENISDKTWPTCWRIWWRGMVCYHLGRLCAALGVLPPQTPLHLKTCMAQYKAFATVLDYYILTATKK